MKPTNSLRRSAEDRILSLDRFRLHPIQTWPLTKIRAKGDRIKNVDPALTPAQNLRSLRRPMITHGPYKDTIVMTLEDYKMSPTPAGKPALRK